MIEFLNPLLLGGLAAISAPVIIHLLHRRKVKTVDWGAMRFLLELMAKRRRRIFMDELLLLLVRALIVTCIALAMLRPSWLGRSEANAVAAVRQGRTASVLLVDDSASSAAGRAQPAFESMKKLGLAYLDSLAPGDEVSVVLMSRLEELGDPIFDLEALKLTLSKLEPSSVASDIPALLDAGMSQLKRCINPGGELVVLTDGRADGWQAQDSSRWEAVRDRLRGNAKARKGSRQHPNVIVLSPATAVIDNNLGIAAISADQSFVAAGQPAGIRVSVANTSPQGTREAAVQLSVNGRVIGSQKLEVPAAGRQEVAFTHTFDQPGSYALEAALLENQDILPVDDRRAFSLNVEASIPVLLLEDGNPEGLVSKLGFLHYALDPGNGPQPAFRVTRSSVAQLLPSTLSQHRVIVLGDVRVLEPSIIDALERFVVGGGGLLVGLGPDTDAAHVNRLWARGGEGFLPCPLRGVSSPNRPPLPAGINLAHPVFTGFNARADEAWKSARVRSYYQLDPGAAATRQMDILLKLDNGDPLLVERRRGLGLVHLLTTSLNADWNELPLQAAYVPLLRGAAGHLGNYIIPPRNVAAGERMIYARWEDPAQTWKAEGPQGRETPLSPGAWEGRNAIVSDPLMQPGIYTLRGTGKPTPPIHFAVAVAPGESALRPLADSEVVSALDRGVSRLHTPEQIAQTLDPARRRSVELWKVLAGAAIALIFIEAWLTRREAGSPAGAL